MKATKREQCMSGIKGDAKIASVIEKQERELDEAIKDDYPEAISEGAANNTAASIPITALASAMRKRPSFTQAMLTKKSNSVLASGRLIVRHANNKKAEVIGQIHYCTCWTTEDTKQHLTAKKVLEKAKKLKTDEVTEENQSFYDCEAAMNTEWDEVILGRLRALKREEPESVVLAFYGTAGPCDGCKKRLVEMLKRTKDAIRKIYGDGIDKKFKAISCFDSTPAWQVRGIFKDEWERGRMEVKANNLSPKGENRPKVEKALEQQLIENNAVLTFYGYPPTPSKKRSDGFAYVYDIEQNKYES